ncbi:MAG: RagB/SusD family nutrient uptake outer membrane protein [Prevotella sp.]|nr:RagB/SusD family nutrient uptake outer membrane protein [Prevotella sp.]
MKLYKLSLALLLGIGTITSCSDKLDVSDPNRQTSDNFGNTADELEECVIACYNHIRMEGTYARVGFNIDVTRGDEVWNSSQVWYLPFDDMNDPVTDEINQWIWRDWYYTINVCNFILYKITDENSKLSDRYKYIKGQALFIRGLAYYNLAGYYQNPALITDYNEYKTLDGLYASNYEDGDADGNAQYDRVLDQVENDFSEAMVLLPTKTLGGQWAKGRATSGAAAGYYARTLMMRHKYAEALTVLKDILSTADGGNQRYGEYKLMADYGDNFQEGSLYENNEESLFEVQFLDLESQGTDDEWTPVNTSPNATQGHAIESNYGPGDFGGWADLSVSPWLYNLYKAERTTSGSLDSRLYWTVGTYESDWEGYAYGNVCYQSPMTATNYVVTNNGYGGLPIAKNTNLRTGLYDKVVTGLHCGINLRMMRYSDVLLRAAECENEISGPTANAFRWINVVRSRAGLPDLDQSKFNTPDKLFEQIANVERPKEFGCEFGRGFDLIRWGFFYSPDRLQQLREHAAVNFWTKAKYDNGTYQYTPKDPVDYNNCSKISFDTYVQGHEFLPINQGTLNANPNLVGNSANKSSNNASYFNSKGWKVRPVVK